MVLHFNKTSEIKNSLKNEMVEAPGCTLSLELRENAVFLR